jgi:hypothetical protein
MPFIRREMTSRCHRNLSGRREPAMPCRGNHPRLNPGWMFTCFEEGKRIMRFVAINNNYTQCTREMRLVSWPKPCRHNFPTQQIIKPNRNIGRWPKLQSSRRPRSKPFTYSHHPMRAPEWASVQNILTDHNRHFVDVLRLPMPLSLDGLSSCAR